MSKTTKAPLPKTADNIRMGKPTDSPDARKPAKSEELQPKTNGERKGGANGLLAGLDERLGKADLELTDARLRCESILSDYRDNISIEDREAIEGTSEAIAQFLTGTRFFRSSIIAIKSRTK